MQIQNDIKRSKRIFVFSIGICLSFFQTIFLIPDSCAQSTAQQATGPIDIQANEQEFAESVVLAKGNVVVTYKDSIVKAPEAKLFRDPDGQPQKAIFVGHPLLTQNDSKISADTLIFEMVNSKFIAQGNAHSEVSSEGDTQVDLKAPPNSQNKDTANKSKTSNKQTNKNLANAKGNANSKQPFAWPQANDDQSAFEKSIANKPVIANEKSEKETNKTDGEQKSPSDKNGKTNTPEKIITDSDYQEYSKETGKFDASGHVHVVHGEISVFADKLKLVYGIDGKPETALFTGHVNAFQGSNNTQAELVTYYLATKRLQATGNVRSRMIQEKQEGNDSKNKASKNAVSSKPSAGGAIAAPSTTNPQNSDDPVIVVSDAQDINQNTGKMSADGNVRVYYQDMTGIGPKVLLLRNSDGRAQKVIFIERSQISQSGKRWIADRITMDIATKKVLAEGNTKAYIIQSAPAKPAPTSTPANTALAMRTSGNKKAGTGTIDKNTGATNGGINRNEIY